MIGPNSNRFSTCLKRKLASVLRIEEYLHAGYVLEDFHQGEEGHCWFIILSGSVNVVVAGKVSLPPHIQCPDWFPFKGIVCTLSDGDDFGS